MINKVIHVDFTRNKKKKSQTFLLLIKRMLKKILSSPNTPTNPDKDRKVIYYKKGIS